MLFHSLTCSMTAPKSKSAASHSRIIGNLSDVRVDTQTAIKSTLADMEAGADLSFSASRSTYRRPLTRACSANSHHFRAGLRSAESRHVRAIAIAPASEREVHSILFGQH
jgi:hypothetical protein